MTIQIFVIVHEELWAAAAFLAVVMKFGVSITFYVVNLQSMETYPTCLRQTGISIGAIVANGLGVLGPFIVYLVSYFICNSTCTFNNPNHSFQCLIDA